MNELKTITRQTLKEKRDVALAVLFGFVAGLAGVALLASSGYLISQAVLTAQMTTLVVLGASLKLFSLTAAVSRYAERLFSHRATFTMLAHLRGSFFEKLVPQSPGLFHRYRSGDLLSRIVGDVESLQNFLLRVFYPPVVLALVFTATVFFASFYSAAIAFVLFAGFVLSVIVVPALFAWRRQRLGSALRESRAALSTEAAEFLYGYRDLKIHQKTEAKEQLLTAQVERYRDETRKEGLEQLLSQSVNAFVTLLVMWAVITLGAYFTAEGSLNGLYLAMLVMVSIAVFENVAPMAVFPAHFNESRVAARRLDAITDGAALPEGAEPVPDGPLTLAAERVTVTYPGEERPALTDVTFRLEPGMKTAVVGSSGSGKSTLLQVLLGTLPADSGSVTAGGKPLEKLDLESLWARLNVVLQENHFFYGTIRSNLLLADEEAADDELREALELAELTSFGLEDPVSEKGQNLSGGEKQRLAIARAFLKRGPIWLMDEPVSSVDAVTAHTVYARLFRARPDDAFLIISHDLSGLETMDQIIVMDQGRILESGTYNELMNRRSNFYELKQIEQSIFAG